MGELLLAADARLELTREEHDDAEANGAHSEQLQRPLICPAQRALSLQSRSTAAASIATATSLSRGNQTCSLHQLLLVHCHSPLSPLLSAAQPRKVQRRAGSSSRLEVVPSQQASEATPTERRPSRSTYTRAYSSSTTELVASAEICKVAGQSALDSYLLSLFLHSRARDTDGIGGTSLTTTVCTLELAVRRATGLLSLKICNQTKIEISLTSTKLSAIDMTARHVLSSETASFFMLKPYSCKTALFEAELMKLCELQVSAAKIFLSFLTMRSLSSHCTCDTHCASAITAALQSVLLRRLAGAAVY